MWLFFHVNAVVPVSTSDSGEYAFALHHNTLPLSIWLMSSFDGFNESEESDEKKTDIQYLTRKPIFCPPGKLLIKPSSLTQPIHFHRAINIMIQLTEFGGRLFISWFIRSERWSCYLCVYRHWLHSTISHVEMIKRTFQFRWYAK